MLFHSETFLFVFLPITLLFFYVISMTCRTYVVHWLLLASIVFYGWWDVRYVPLIVGSIVLNFAFGRLLDAAPEARKRRLLAIGIVLNLLPLIYFKYWNFLLSNLTSVTGVEIATTMIVLPIGVSFFTFQQIAYLVDVAKRRTFERGFVPYALFVSFFPHLIAGPLVHHRQIAAQLADLAHLRLRVSNACIGLTIFAVGLFKKAVLADGIAPYATQVFAAAEAGTPLTFFEAWSGAIAYSLQLYFDFSGYSDMAIGLARMFNVRLPINFYSPYKATSISDFWRRWHMTLSAFLRDYVYIPLGGSRVGAGRGSFNLMATMLLGGLWHGASWTFVVWGGLHGLALVVQRLWRSAFPADDPGRMRRTLGWLATLTFVVACWVPFRAESFAATLHVWIAMAGGGGISLPVFAGAGLGADAREALSTVGIRFTGIHGTVLDIVQAAPWIVAGGVIALLMPNIQQVMSRLRPTSDWRQWAPVGRLPRWARWRPSAAWAIACGVMACIAIFTVRRGTAQFLYYNF